MSGGVVVPSVDRTRRNLIMKDDRNATMAEALRLTRDGRLMEATALLQQGLGVAGQPTPARPVPARLQTQLPLDLPLGRPVGLPGSFPLVRPSLGRSGSSPAAAAAASAPGGEIRHLTHSEVTGSRTYHLYIPTGYVGEPVPLVIMLHGGTQDATDFAAGTRMNDLAELRTFLVAYPEQSTAANNGRYWNWFRSGDQQRNQGEPAIIAGITRQIMSDFAVDEARVYIVGFSSGGAMTAVMAAAYPDLYAAAGIHSGLAPGAAHDLPSAFAAMQNGGTAGFTMKVPVIVFHGDRDNIVAPINADRVIASRIRAASGIEGQRPPTTTDGEDQPGHSVSRKIYRDGNDEVVAEQWIAHGGSHAWFGGSPVGSYTDAQGPDASAEMLRFFLEHPSRVTAR
jgi:poly(hydroxyalkanoate) depolymerase family esterase